MYKIRIWIYIVLVKIYAILKKVWSYRYVFYKLNIFGNYLKVFYREWLYTTNHKKLGLNYLLFAALSGLFGTTLSSLIRLELAQPGSLVFANNANAYHVVVGMHAIVMIFFLVTPLVFGGFGNYFLPIQVGARDVAYPRLNNFSLWILPAGLITVLRTLWEGMRVSQLNIVNESNFSSADWEKLLFEIKFLNNYSTFNFLEYNFISEIKNWINLTPINTCGLNYIYCNISLLKSINFEEYLPVVNNSSNLLNTMAGWTFTTPFSYSRFTGAPVDWAMGALLMSTFSSILTLINLVITWRFLKGRGSRFQKEFFPIVLISIFISIRVLIIVSPILNAGLLMLMADRHFFTAFFTVRAGGDILLFQHLFWFFGHPEVYVLIMPAFGITSTLIPYYVRKPLGSKMHMVYAMHAIASMGFVVWGHHMYLVGLDNKARILFFVITVLIALPASIKVCGWIASLLNSTTFLTIELLFSLAFVGLFIIGGLSGSFCAHTGTDIILHDTYYIVGHFHVMLSGSLTAMFFGYIYYNFRELLGLYYIWFLSFNHLICHTLGHMVTFVPMLWLGYAGMPRRIQDYPWGYAGWHSVATLGHTIVLFGIINFILLVNLSIYLKRPTDSKNKGFPFIQSRVAYLLLNKYYSALSVYKKQVAGNAVVRSYNNEIESRMYI